MSRYIPELDAGDFVYEVTFFDFTKGKTVTENRHLNKKALESALRFWRVSSGPNLSEAFAALLVKWNETEKTPPPVYRPPIAYKFVSVSLPQPLKVLRDFL